MLLAPNWQWGWPDRISESCVSRSLCGPPRASWAAGDTPAPGTRLRWKPLSAPTPRGKPHHSALSGLVWARHFHPGGDAHPLIQKALTSWSTPCGRGQKGVRGEGSSAAMQNVVSLDASFWKHYQLQGVT